VFTRAATRGRAASGESTGLNDGAWNAEELLCRLMPSWRVVAIGRPGERLQKPGAARLYVDDGLWTSVVAELMASSRLVFLGLNGEKTEGIDWEIDNLAKRGHLQKTIILSLDDDNRPLRFGSISRTLRPADVNNELANIPPLQSQQAIYHAGGGWHSIFTNDL